MHTKEISFQPARFAQYDSLWKLPLLHPKTQILLLPSWPQWGEILSEPIFMQGSFNDYLGAVLPFLTQWLRVRSTT